MASSVYFIDLKTDHKRSLLGKIGTLVDATGIRKVVKRRGLTAVKLHFGDEGAIMLDGAVMPSCMPR